MAIKFINQLTSYLLLVVVAAGSFSALMQSFKWITASDEGEADRAKKNIIKIVKGTILALSITGLVKIMFSIL